MEYREFKGLFSKYICFVKEEEGTNFIDRLDGRSDTGFTDEEIETLKELSGENGIRCPVCGRERNSKTANKLAVCTCLEHGMLGEHVDPGGRLLRFPFGECRIGDMCNWCDYEKIKEHCTKNGKKGLEVSFPFPTGLHRR